MKEKVKTKKEELAELLAESRAARKEAEDYLVSQGKKYSLSQWVTIKEYAKRFDLESTNVVTNWINRGVIPKENVILIEDLNNLRLVKAIPYKE